jgi:uncharacterized repeat protein (TIGR02543 family)
MRNEKKAWIFLFAFLFSLFSFSCQNPFGPDDPREKIPLGKGSFSLSLPSVAVRTIMPKNAPNEDIFESYTLIFTVSNGSPGTALTTVRGPNDISEPVYLVVGKYDLEVLAYYAGDQSNPAARGNIKGIDIVANTNKTERLALKAIIGEPDTTGTFSFPVTLPPLTEMETATMVITNFENPADVVKDVNLLTDNTKTLTLPTGYYDVVFTLLKKNNTALVRYEVLHVYSGLESIFNHNFTTGDQFSAWTVPVTGVTLSETTLLLTAVDPPVTLIATVQPSTADPSVTWSSSNTSVATVENGIVTAKAGGTATITATSVADSTKKADCTVTVPFLIYYEADLRKVGRNESNNGWTLSAHYKVMADIPTLTQGNWTPIGNSSTRFTGSFDGNNKSISGLSINAPSSNYQGMFGFIGVGGTVKNLALINCTVSASPREEVGGLVGYNLGTVENCYTTGTVSGKEDVGGVVGGNVGTVKDCYTTSTISGTDYVGGVVGYNFEESTVENCYFTGTVSGTNYVGGVVGGNSGAVKNCYTTGNISGSNLSEDVGGVVGYNDSTVENCYATGNVSGGEDIGGVVGRNYEGTVKNCYATGNVSGTDYVGGVVGYHDKGVAGTVGNCVGLNGQITVSGGLSNKDYGRVVGYSMGNNTLTNNYARSDMTPPSGGNFNASANATGRNGSGITFANWGTNTWWTSPAAFNLTATGVWEWLSANNLPILSGLGTQDPKVSCTVTFNSNSGSAVAAQIVAAGNTASSPTAPTRSGFTFGGWYTDNNTFNTQFNFNTTSITSHITLYAKWNANAPVGGTGTSGDPFLINNEAQLRQFEKGTNDWTLDKHYRLMVDITLSGTNNWTPVGDSWDSFTGSFDGNNKSITGLNITTASNDDQGMFGGIGSSGVVNNLALISCTITGSGWSVGGVVGTNKGTVKNCYTTGNISGFRDVGGVVGTNNGIVENCYASSDISGTGFYVGGVVGNNEGTVKNCFATGNIDTSGGGTEIGGVVGNNYNGTVQNCYATGNVNGNTSVGGVVGYNHGTVENCYATGNVSGNNYVGGVVGYGIDSTVRNCVGLNKQIIRTTGIATSFGRVVGYSNTLVNNYGRENMISPTGNWTATNLTGKDGASVATNDAIATTPNWWTGTGRWSTANDASAWNFTNTWNPPNGTRLPTLQNMPGNPPQNPQINP